MGNLTVVGELIKVTENENDEQVISGRELYDFLEVQSSYTTWMHRQIEFGFEEGIDFIPNLEESTGGRPRVNHVITMDMAQQISMLQRNEKGQQARKYFSQIAKDWNTPDKIMSRALKIAERTLAKSRVEVKALQHELDISKEWFSIKRVAQLNNMDWRLLNWRTLKKTSNDMDLPVPKIFDANYGSVNTYHITVFKQVYPELKFK